MSRKDREFVAQIIGSFLFVLFAFFAFTITHEIFHMLSSEDAQSFCFADKQFYVMTGDSKVKTYASGPIFNTLLFVPIGIAGLIYTLTRKWSFSVFLVSLMFIFGSLAGLLPIPGTDFGIIWERGLD